MGSEHCPVCKFWFSEGRPGLVPPVGENRQPGSDPPTSVVVVFRGQPGLFHDIFPLQNPTIVDNREM